MKRKEVRLERKKYATKNTQIPSLG
jgi:hypothetical protein